MNADDIVIVSGVRTPMGGFQGSLSGISAPELGAITLREAIQRANLAPEDIDEVIMGSVLPAGLKQGPARQAMRLAGIPDNCGATTINKLCGSGMKAAMFAYDSLKAGSAEIIAAGGMESMTNAPYVLEKARSGYRMGHGAIKDHMFLDGLEDAETGRLMGSFAQDVADKHNLSREEMDNFAIESLARANKAIADGAFEDESVAVTVKTRKGETVVSVDEQPGNARPDKIPQLKPAFAKDGTVTAANSSSISDGASALILTTGKIAQERGLKPLAKIVAHATNSRHPSEFTLAPGGSITKVLDKAGWSIDEVDLFEINEAFAMVTLLSMKEHNIPHDKVNVHGGACALGHPLGSSGSRIMISLIYALQRYGKKKGIASLCIGGGEATAVAIELF